WARCLFAGGCPLSRHCAGLLRSDCAAPGFGRSPPDNGGAGMTQAVADTHNTSGLASPADEAPRIDLLRIAQWIAPGSRALDLGCADGHLLAYLQNTRQVQGAGVELADEQVIAAVRRGVRVIQQNLEEGLALFDDQQFDTVVLSQTLQSMHHTEHILREMAR